MAYQVLETVVPGITITTNTRSKYLLCRIYDKATQTTINRSTGKEDLAEAKAWVLANLQDLFQAQPTERGGGRTSIKRALVNHLEWQRERRDAGFISESTYEGYAKTTRHLLKWFPDGWQS